MTTECLVIIADAAQNAISGTSNRHALASRESEAIRVRLHEALAREDVLRREMNELTRKLGVQQETTANRVAGLTSRERQIMELVLLGHPSKNIAADLGIS